MSEEDTDTDSNSRMKKLLGVPLLFLVGFGLLVAVSPFIKPIVYLLYTQIWIVELSFIMLLASFLMYRKWKTNLGDDPSQHEINDLRETAFSFFLTGMVLSVVIVGVLMGIASNHAMGQETIGSATTIDEMYEGDADRPRVVTRAQAERWASGSLQSSQFQSSGNAIVVRNNTTYWGSNLVPDGSLRNTLAEKQNGTVLVNAETFQKDVTVIRGDMRVGRGMQIRDNYQWKLNHVLSDGPWMVNYHDNNIRPIVHEGEQYLMVPYTRPHHHLLPLTYSHPQEGGVALIHQNGSINHYTLEQAQDVDALDGQPLMPSRLVRQQVSATTYRAGIVDTLPVIGGHEQTISIASVPGEDNQQPFYFQTAENGAQYVTAAEPTGNTQGLRELWFTDVRTGESVYYSSNGSSTLYGPRKSADFVVDANDRTDWERFSPSEPIPTVVEGQLYWQFRVVQDGGGGITFISLVNADSQSVTNIDDTEGTEALSAFMRGEDLTDIPDTNVTDETPDNNRNPTIVMERLNENGEVVETMYIYENETVVTRDYQNNSQE